jgi:hypothetical protein
MCTERVSEARFCCFYAVSEGGLEPVSLPPWDLREHAYGQVRRPVGHRGSVYGGGRERENVYTYTSKPLTGGHQRD